MSGRGRGRGRGGIPINYPDGITAKAVSKSPFPDLRTPEGLKEQCQGIANKGAGRGSSPGADYPGFAQRRDVYKLLKGGCVDLSTITPMEQLPGKCPGLVACNIIRDPFRGGPMCGMRLRQWGDFAIPDGSEAIAGEPPLMPCAAQTSGTGNSLPCPSTMRHGR